ncbi:MAG: hypothetical protein J6Z49_12495 [Kiritimatiellae bacterium]|nr:hypothetical protein [Kiritimatiellia bacterium]
MGETKGSLERKIFKAGGFVLLAHLLFKFAGLIQAKVMGHFLPQSTFDVVYAVAFENCIFMLFLIGEEIIGPSFLPVFMRELDGGDERGAWSFANTVLTLQFLILLVVAGVLAFCPHAVVRFLTQWSDVSSPEKYELAASSIRTLAPAVVGLSLGSTTYVLLNGYKRFFLAAFGDAVWKFCVVAFLFAGALLSKDSAMMLMWGLVAGSLCKVGTHLFGLHDKLRFIRPAFDFRNPAFKRLCWLALPLLAGIVVAKIRDEVNNVYLLSSLKESGLMQANSMGRKLQATFLFLVPYTLSVAAFPFFCELVDRNDHAKLGALLTKFGRILLAVFLPFSAYVAIAAVPLTTLLFKGGHFDATAVQRTAVSLAFYTLALPAAAVEALCMQAFFANRRMVSVTVVGILFSALSVLISWLGLRFLGTGQSLALLAVIAGGFALSRTLKTFSLIHLLKRNAPLFPAGETWGFLARVMAASLLAAGAAWFGQGLVSGKHALIQLAAGGAAFGVVYLAAARCFGIGELLDLFSQLLQKHRSVNGQEK